MIILGIESSCDETSVAVVENGHIVHSQILATSLKEHISTGGIVPEVAARAQIEYIIPVLQAALQEFKTSEFQISQNHHPRTLTPSHPHIDSIAVTTGPGLIGSLLVGVETAKALAYAWNKPLIPVNHMLGHIYGAWITHGQKMNDSWPKLALLVSGNHSELILMESHSKMRKISWTLDDAAGEAFDKAARLLGLPYPGGPQISRLAENGNPNAIQFPQPMPGKDNYHFSFSGLKTALLHYVRQNPDTSKADIAASFQQAIIKSLVTKTQRAAEHYQVKEVILGGGVAANQQLRKQLIETLNPTLCKIPDFAYTTDNAAVIASAAYYHNHPTDTFKVNADPSLELPIIGN